MEILEFRNMKHLTSFIIKHAKKPSTTAKDGTRIMASKFVDVLLVAIVAWRMIVQMPPTTSLADLAGYVALVMLSGRFLIGGKKGPESGKP